MNAKIHEKMCPDCGLKSMVTKAMIRLIERGINSARCHSCCKKGNKYCLGNKATDETKKKMSLKHKGKKLTKEHCEKISAFRKGKPQPHCTGVNNYRWIKDRSKVVGRDRAIINDVGHVGWRKKVFNRDGFKCQMSDANCCSYLEAHHIIAWRDSVELRFDVNNGITLCRNHHPRKRSEEKRLIPFFNELVANKYQYIES